ncbi:MAG: (2Fe-2S)-binding protein, partial [Vicinamibacterales bacterium]
AAVWVPRRNADLETTVPGIYAAGDGAGVAGAVVAADEGRIAGLAAACAQARLTPTEAASRIAPIRSRLQSLAAFRAAMDALYAIRPGLHELASPATIICRCEERTAGELLDAVREGARTMDHLKAWTRCGMGSCNARMCELPAAHLLSREMNVAVSTLGSYRARPPVKPVPIEALVNDR